MDMLDRLLAQVNTLKELWPSFIVVWALTGLFIWRAMDWRYNGIIEHLREQVAHYEKGHAPSITRTLSRSDPSPDEPLSLPPLIDSASTPTEERVFLPSHVTFESLMKLREGLSGIKGDRITAPYRGKWIRVTGVMVGSGTRLGGVYISIVPGPLPYTGPHMDLYFSADTDGIDVFTNGDKVAAIGKIMGIIQTGVVLAECELT